ncbi:serpin-like protein [Medicago truncatula]|uniref:Serpin-like protein n=1 Tax=Medicago truncatula TaxID=3880 RepID=A0A072UMV3_MEDTR|nr:serpin-like protein [Medicago truncatula]
MGAYGPKKESEKNIVFSPLSLQVVLAIIAAGSDGSTRQQLLNFLQFKSAYHLNSFVSQLISVIFKDATPSHGPRLFFVNSVWLDKTLSPQPSFKHIVTTDYKATLSSVDFQNKAIEVTKEVNLWAKKETNGLIKKVVAQESVNNLTRLIFANALYFKGAWIQPFSRCMTKKYDFHLLNGSSVKVPFMTSSLDQFIRAFDGFKVLRLPYKQGKDERKFSMYIFLPNAKDGLSALVEKVASEFELLEHKLPYKTARVGGFKIPRFKFSSKLESSHMLKDLGVILPFSSGGLTKMVDSLEGQNLSVSNIFQKCFIEVNEKGTKAVAASTTLFTLGRSTGLDFIADHPFLFLIREDLTQTILFAGQVFNPLC